MKQSSLRSQFWGGAFDVDPPVSGGFDTCWERWVMASRLLTEQAGTFISRRRWGFFRWLKSISRIVYLFTYINWVRKVMCTFFSEKCKNVGQSICKGSITFLSMLWEKSTLPNIYQRFSGHKRLQHIHHLCKPRVFLVHSAHHPLPKKW